MKKILIIEDNPIHYRLLADVLKKEDVTVYPGNSIQLTEFRSALNPYVLAKNDDTQKRLLDEIKKINPDLIVLDIGLNPQNKFDKTGIDIFNDLLGVHLNNIPVAIFSLSAKTEVKDLIKRPVNDFEIFTKPETFNILWENQVNEYILKWIRQKLDLKLGDTSEVVKKGVFARIIMGIWHIGLAPLQVFTDGLVVVIFYLSIIFCAFLGAYFLYQNIVSLFKNEETIIHISENTFIIFLPLLIVSGFFVFYKNVLKIAITGYQSDLRDDNIESSSVLMKLTKKLFISSIISYLFIRIVELIYPSETNGLKLLIEKNNQNTLAAIKKLNVKVFTDSISNVINANSERIAIKTFEHYNIRDYTQVLFLAGCIFSLVLYYVYLDNHKKK